MFLVTLCCGAEDNTRSVYTANDEVLKCLDLKSILSGVVMNFQTFYRTWAKDGHCVQICTRQFLSTRLWIIGRKTSLLRCMFVEWRDVLVEELQLMTNYGQDWNCKLTWHCSIVRYCYFRIIFNFLFNCKLNFTLYLWRTLRPTLPPQVAMFALHMWEFYWHKRHTLSTSLKYFESMSDLLPFAGHWHLFPKSDGLIGIRDWEDMTRDGPSHSIDWNPEVMDKKIWPIASIFFFPH